MAKKNMLSDNQTRKGNSMPAFLKKKKRDPKSENPAKNTRGKSVNKLKSKEAQDGEQDRGGDQVPAAPMPNKADAALAALTKPRDKRKGYQA